MPWTAGRREIAIERWFASGPRAARLPTSWRAVAEFFFGDYPKAVQDAERAVRDFCAS